MKHVIFSFLALVGTASPAFAETPVTENADAQDPPPATVSITQRYSAGEIFYCGKVESKEAGPFIVTVVANTFLGASPFSTVTDAENKFCGIVGPIGSGTDVRQKLKATARGLRM